MALLQSFWSGSIPPRIQYVALGMSLVLLVTIIHLVREGRLKEGYSILWFVLGVGIVLFSFFTRSLDIFARLVGISYTPAALFLVLVGGLVLLSVHFSVLVTRYDKRISELAQEHAILKAELLTHQKKQ